MTQYARTVWRCRRGMKELDVLLERYLRLHYHCATEAQREAFEELLNLQDPRLYALLLGRETATDCTTRNVIDTIRRTPDH